MPDYRLSAKARSDLIDIADYSFDTFGYERANIYRDSLFAAFQRLAEHPELGNSFRHIKPGLRRLIHDSHAIYYRLSGSNVFILRILHQSRDPMRHL